MIKRFSITDNDAIVLPRWILPKRLCEISFEKHLQPEH